MTGHWEGAGVNYTYPETTPKHTKEIWTPKTLQVFECFENSFCFPRFVGMVIMKYLDKSCTVTGNMYLGQGIGALP